MWLHEERYSGGDKFNEFQFWCCNGKPKFVSVICQPHGENYKITYDLFWNKLPFITSLPRYDGDIIKPSDFDVLVEKTKQLCQNTTFVRVDFMRFQGKWYFGELTFYPAGGYVRWNPAEADESLGKVLECSVILQEKEYGHD